MAFTSPRRTNADWIFKLGLPAGLALPFLVSWFAGDFTNLLG